MAGNWVARWPCQASPPGVLLRQWLPSGRWKWLVVIVVIIIIIIIIIPSINGLVRSKIYRKHCLYFVPATYFSLSQFWEGRDGEIKMLEIRSYWSCIKRLNTSADMLLRGEIPVTFASWTWAFTGYLPNLSSSVINWAIPIFLLLKPMITHVTGYQPTPSDVSPSFWPYLRRTLQLALAVLWEEHWEKQLQIFLAEAFRHLGGAIQLLGSQLISSKVWIKWTVPHLLSSPISPNLLIRF